MARPCKAAKTLADCSQTKAEMSARAKYETQIGGSSDKIRPPSWMSKSQKKIFRDVVNELSESGILKNLDVPILTEFSFALDMKCNIEKDINECPSKKYDRYVISSLNKFTQTFFRCCNELSLSPQSRAKIANAAAAANDGTKELMKIIQGE